MYEENARWLASVICSEVDPCSTEVPGMIVLLRAQYAGRGDAGMMDLIRRAEDARLTAQRVTDSAFLQRLIDRNADFFDDALYDRLALVHERYRGDAAMLGMFNRAATAYGDAVITAAEWAMAGLDAIYVIDKAMGREE